MKEVFPKLLQSCTELCELEIPQAFPKGVSFECIETRLLKAYRKISRLLGYKKGELYPNKTKGAINDLLCSNESIKLNCYETIELLIRNGADTIILSAHTDCAADKALRGVRPYEEDRAYQLDKLKRAFMKMDEFSKVKKYSLKIRCFFLDIVGQEVTIYEVNHYMSDDISHPAHSDSHESQTIAATV